MAFRNSSRDIASGWICVSAIGHPSFDLGEFRFDHIHERRNIAHAYGVEPGITRCEPRVRSLVTEAEARDRLEVDVDAALAQRRLEPLADLDRAAAPAARHELFLAHVDAERERGSGREAFRPRSEQRLHSTRAPESRMARPHLATSDSTN